jgi:outer membrane receptor protein involved in Fe transport
MLSDCRLGFLLVALAVGLGSAAARGAPGPVEPLPSNGEPLEEVIVTAQLRARALSDTPASTTVLSADTLQAAGQQHLQDLLGLVPNLNWSAGTSRPRFFQLRGIGELEQWLGAPNPSVALLIDGVDFSGVGTPATLFDIEQVEVLRGPQGTGFGANALAGVIALRSAAPTRQFLARGELTVGDYATSGAGVALSGPLALDGDIAGRLAVQRQTSDGFRRNTYLARDNTNGYDETTIRGRVRFATSTRWDWDLAAFWFDVDNGYDAFAVDNSRITLSDRPGRDAQRSGGFASRVEYRASALTLLATAAWQDSRSNYSFDGDWGNPASWGDNGPYDFFQQFDRRRRVASQDLRVSSRDDASTKWVAGLHATRLAEDGAQQDLSNGTAIRMLDSRYRASNVAAYAEYSAPLSARADATVGGRVERRDVTYRDNEANAFTPTETMWGGNAALTYRLRGAHRLYGSVSRGYKAGGFNLGVAVPEERRLFGAETLTNVEMGIRGDVRSAAFEYSAALFSMHRRDQQVDTSVQLVPGDPLTFLLLTDNAARGKNEGFEATVAWQASPRWQLGGSLAWLVSEFTEYRSSDRDVRGRDQPHAPHFQGSAFAQLVHPRGWFARVDVSGNDGFYFSASHDERSHAYALVNAKLGIRGERFAADFWVRNLFDADWSHRGFFFGNEPPDFPAKRYTQAGDPRQVGLTLRYAFGLSP